jgi:hypothetical protein
MLEALLSSTLLHKIRVMRGWCVAKKLFAGLSRSPYHSPSSPRASDMESVVKD